MDGDGEWGQKSRGGVNHRESNIAGTASRVIDTEGHQRQETNGSQPRLAM